MRYIAIDNRSVAFLAALAAVLWLCLRARTAGMPQWRNNGNAMADAMAKQRRSKGEAMMKRGRVGVKALISHCYTVMLPNGNTKKPKDKGVFRCYQMVTRVKTKTRLAALAKPT